jgi:hypothetical protein
MRSERVDIDPKVLDIDTNDTLLSYSQPLRFRFYHPSSKTTPIETTVSIGVVLGVVYVRFFKNRFTSVANVFTVSKIRYSLSHKVLSLSLIKLFTLVILHMCILFLVLNAIVLHARLLWSQ